MELNGKPFVPPTCPRRHNGGSFPLDEGTFQLFSMDGNDSRTNQRETGVMGIFEDVRNSENVVATPYEFFPYTSSTAEAARELSSDADAEARVGMAFCHRVAECHGVIDGECWALGARALTEVVAQVHSERNDHGSESN